MSTASATPAFHHTDAGTPESTWLGTDRWDDVPSLDLAGVADRFDEVLVVAAHPDDETLGVGALLADLTDAGVRVHVLVATDGERSHPVADDGARDRLARLRRREVECAVNGLAPGARVTHLGLADTSLPRHEPQLRDAVADHCAPGTLVLAPWLHDGHGDHDAVGRACTAVSDAMAVALAHYPIWLWHWATPDDLPWPQVVAVEPSRPALWRRRSALAEFRSQVTPRGGPEVEDEGAAPVVGPAVLSRAERVVEVLLDPRGVLPVRASRAAATVERTAGFDAMYDDGPDPWGFTGSFYEDRRRALVLALLSRPRYDRVLEIGCAAGDLTAELVERAGEVTAIDTSPRAVAAATDRAPDAVVTVGTVPDDLPAGPFDLVVLSEVGYFLSPLELLATLRRCEAALTPEGELLLCHWRHPTTGVPLDGPLVHEQARAMLRRPPSARALDADVVVETWRRGPSVAMLEGRA